MQLFKSLFCFKGFDNRSRFIVISIATYTTFIIINATFSNYLFITISALVCLVVINTLTSLRRLSDAQLNKNWSIGPSLTFFIASLIMLLTGHNSADWFLLIPMILSSLLLTYPSKNSSSYILGYSGPVDLSDFDHSKGNKHKHNQRIEPTMLSSNSQSIPESNNEALAVKHNLSSVHHEVYDTDNEKNFRIQNNKEVDIGESIRLKLLSGKNAKLTLLILSLLILSILLVSFLISSFKNKETLPLPSNKTNIKVQRVSQISFPDNFSLWLSQHEGLIINWQADKSLKSQIWNIDTADGEKSCKEITFNDGNKIRTTTVAIENSDDYFANFSPLDTQDLLQSIAFRGSFKLCGYEFSLKGSQAIIGKHADYAAMVSY